MTVAQRHVAQQYAGRGGPSGLADVLEVLLDKGLVIDAYVRVSLVGIELLTIDVRVVVASVDTYLRFAEATNRLDLTNASNAQTLGELVGKEPPRNRRRRDDDDEDESDGDRRGFVSRALGRDRDDDEPEAHAGDDLDGGSDEQAAGGEDGDIEDVDRDDETDGADTEDDDEPDEAPDEESEDESGSGVLSRIKQRGQAF